MHGLFGIGHGSHLEGTFQALPKGSQAAGGLLIAVFDHPLQTFRLIELKDIGHGICADLQAPGDNSVLDPLMVHHHDQKPVLELRLNLGIIKDFRNII